MVYQWGEWTMEESSPQNSNGQVGTTGGVSKPNENSNQRPQYSIPGILHYIQHEWAKFEMERSQWEVHRAELEAKIAFLQGERKGQENLKNDLIRRIKMLEYALKLERAKFHKLKYGTELNQGDMNAPVFDEPTTNTEINIDTESPFTSVSNVTFKQGRALLRQYLQELGYTDTIVDVRNNKVQAFLGLNNNNNSIPTNNNNNAVNDSGIQGENASSGQAVNGSPEISNNKRRNVDSYVTNTKKAILKSIAFDTEASIMANFDFLEGDVDMDEDDGDMNDVIEDGSKSFLYTRVTPSKQDMYDVDVEAEEVLNELQSLTESEEVSDIRSQGGSMFQPSAPNREDDTVDSSFALGELAQLTVNNEAENSYDMASSKEPYRKTWSAKYTLRSHFDGVRALAFHPVEPVLITASEDRSLKLWNLQKIVTSKKSASLDVEPLYTFRKHVSPVLCVAMNSTGEECYSGCLSGQIYCWNVPSADIDPYDSYDPKVLSSQMEGHTNAVWGLQLHLQKLQLLSCSADGTVKLWSPSKQPSLLSTFASEQDGIPTSADFVRNDTNHIVVSYKSGSCVIYDIETAQSVLRLEQPSERSSHDQVNRLICHPTLPLTITAHEDRHIRFFDNSSGQMVHWMVAHLDAVTSLALDPSGLFLLSGSHDCSIRIWNLDTKTCVQEITAHRKKFDESIHDVAFHPSKPYIASSGADGLAKVFVC